MFNYYGRNGPPVHEYISDRELKEIVEIRKQTLKPIRAGW